MCRLRRPRLERVLRTGLLLVLALCMAFQPVLAAVGELHELAQHEESVPGHLDGAWDSHGPEDAAGTSHDPNETLHVLLHFAHCCGHSNGLTTGGLAQLAPPVRACLSAPRIQPPRPAERLGAPFRPPIPG
jgi:hypothetical protein